MRNLDKKLITLIFCVASAQQLNAEFQVNTRTSLSQASAAIAADSNGSFVVVWSSYYSGKSNEIRGRRFSADSSPIDANEFEVNTTQTGNQKEPDVAMDAEGNFVVVWQGPGISEDDIFAQRFDANGQKIDGEFMVNTVTSSDQILPSAAMNASGRFIVVWESDDLPEPGNQAICAQCYDSNGLKLGSEIILNDPNLPVCRYPDVAMGNDSNAIVVWVWDGSKESIWRRTFPADGNNPPYNAHKVNDSLNIRSLTMPTVCVDSAGNYIIAWDGRTESYEEDDIYVRPYHWSNIEWPSQYMVNTTIDNTQRNPAVAFLTDANQGDWGQGTFVVLWEGDCDSNDTKRDIFGQRMFVDYNLPLQLCKIGDEFRVNTYTFEEQVYPAVARTSENSFAAAWQSFGQDGSGYGIFAETGPKVGSADVDVDGDVDLGDYCVMAGEWLNDGNDLEADLVDDNRINKQDLSAMGNQWLTLRYSCGDVELSGDTKIDFADFAKLAANWQMQGPLSSDIDGNGVVNTSDLKWLLLHWAKSCE